ncbi:MAG TPA: LLM class F420-dependent oxidoreductase [Acidimicrobiia bacterium]|nr:LLM class F420-dependent oxidoreductase [Acidimicrobiia bacterium]
MNEQRTWRGVVAPFWLDRPGEEALGLATAAERLGYREFWVGEMLHFDAFALAGAIAHSTKEITVTVGPLAIGLRDPVLLAMGVGSVETIGGRQARLAVGASSPTLVEGWHGRSHGGEAERIEEAIGLIRAVLGGERTDHRGASFQSIGFRSGLGKRSEHITVAAAGARMTAAAARSADRIVLNLVTPERTERVAQQFGLPLAVWVVAAVDPTPSAIDQIRRQLSLYLSAPGYRESLGEAGFGGLVDKVRDGARPKDVAGLITTEMMAAIAAIGSAAEVSATVDLFEEAGAEVMLVPVTAGDEGATRTLRALA